MTGLAPDLVAVLIGLTLHATYTRWMAAPDDQDVAALAATVLAELRTAVTSVN